MCLWPTDYAEFIESVVSQIKGEGEWGHCGGHCGGHHAQSKNIMQLKNMQCQNLKDL